MIELIRRPNGATLEPDETPEVVEEEFLHDAEAGETLPADVIAIERWLTEGGRVLPGEFDQ